MSQLKVYPDYLFRALFGLLFGLIVLLPDKIHALTINEVAYDVRGADTNREWIELYNETSISIDLTGAKLQAIHNLPADPPPSPTLTGSQIQSPPVGGGRGTLVMEPGGYLILAQKPDLLLIDNPDLPEPWAKVSFSALANYQADETKRTTLKVINKEGLVLGETSYSPGPRETYPEGTTIEYQVDNGWQPSKELGGTPGRVNSTWSLASPTPQSYPSGVRFSEIYPNAVGDDKGHEWIEFENTGSNSVDLTGWYMVDTSGKKELLSANTMLEPGAFRQVIVSSLSINNDSTKTAEELRLYWPSDQETDRVTLVDKAKEDWSYARFSNEWWWTDQPTPGSKNQQLQATTSPTSSHLMTPSPQLTITSRQQPSSVPTISKLVKLAVTEKPVSTPTSRPKPKSTTNKLTPKSQLATLRPELVSPSPRTARLSQVKGVTTNNHRESSRPILITGLVVIVLSSIGLVALYRYKLLSFIPKLRSLWPPEVLK